MLIKILGLIVLFSHIISPSIASSLRTVDYDTAWEEGKFSGKTLQNVSHLVSNGKLLDDTKKNYLIDSLTLTNLRVLDLSNQDITDDFIMNMCGNPTFSRVININLSGNPNLTSEALKYISQSASIGSIRDLPQFSSQYEKPSSEIYIDVRGTGIGAEIVKQYNTEPENKDFFIRYLHPATGKATSQPANHAIKWLRIK
jgi:hypothetical protein